VRKISLPPGFDPRTVHPVVSRYTDCALPAHRKCVGCVENIMPCFMCFCCNAPSQYSPLFNLHPLIFSLMLYGWLPSFMLTLTYFIFLMKISYFYLYPFDVHPLFAEHNYFVKQGLGVERPVTFFHHLQCVQFTAYL
jgi:hypothetical protein